jgi:hypothetical protein
MTALETLAAMKSRRDSKAQWNGKDRRRMKREPHVISMSAYGDAETPDDVFFAVMSGKLWLLTERIKAEQKRRKK